MDFEWKDIFIPQQSEDIPFIGDVMNLVEMENFETKKKVQVTSISFDGRTLLAQVAAKPDFKNVPAGFDYVVVEARLLTPVSGNAKELEIIWNFSGDFAGVAVKHVLIDQEVTPGPFLLKSFVVITIADFSAIESMPSALSLNSDYFDSVNMILERANKCEQDSYHILTDDDKKSVNKLKKFAWGFEQLVRTDILKKANDLSSENWIHATSYIMNAFMAVKERNEMAMDFIDSVEMKCAKKREIIQYLAEKEVKCLNTVDEFKKLTGSVINLYVIFINMHGWETSQHILDGFLRMKSEIPAQFVAVDLDMVNIKGLKPFVIKTYRNGHCIYENLLQEIKSASRTMAKCTGKHHNLSPKSRALLEMSCPGFNYGDCPSTKLKWTCFHCQSQLYYGFDRYCYCYCGAAAVTDLKFRCGRRNHKEDFCPIKDYTGLDALPKIDPLNIIILGQSGVGKSTWINAFVNYMTYKSLGEARNSEFPVPIPVKFSITDENYKQVDVICGNYDEEENLKVGESATQACKEYNIVFDDKVINLIDTPGLGDSRGIDEDKKNLKKILGYLGSVDEIHGICLVLKPNEARLTVLFKYCLKEILSNLHKSCKENLIFCFTHARQTFYRSGETQATLKVLLKEIGVGESCLERSFHMDNEAFRFLCCQYASVKFSKDEEESFAESWERSSQATKELLEAVARLAPHRTQDTKSLNRSRNIILNLIPFMVEISENIERNVHHLEDHQRMIETHEGTLDELKSKRYSPQIDIERMDLDHPRTVCASEECVHYEFLPQSGERRAIYKTHCHPHCGLSGQTPDVFPNPELIRCWAMNGTNNCRNCQCCWDIHIHVWYEQQLIEKMVIDDDIEQKINDYTDANKFKADLIASYQRKIAAFESEKRAIISNCVKFASFLKANAIVAYNDSFLDYFELTLRTLKKLKVKTELDVVRIKKMKETKQLYVEERKLFESLNSEVSVTLEQISKCEKELYDLPLHGEKLQKIMIEAIARQASGPRDSSNTKTIVARNKPREYKKIMNILGNDCSLGESHKPYEGSSSRMVEHSPRPRCGQPYEGNNVNSDNKVRIANGASGRSEIQERKFGEKIGKWWNPSSWYRL